MDKIYKMIGAAIVGVIVLVLFSLLLALPVWWLWNILMPSLFNLPEVTLMQAWGLNVLSGFLFKSHTSSSK